MTKASNVILVHGAWADGSSWSKVIPLLLNGRLRVTATETFSPKAAAAKPCRDAGAPGRDSESDLGNSGPCLAIQCEAEVRTACVRMKERSTGYGM
jgi:hypothetical protein